MLKRFNWGFVLLFARSIAVSAQTRVLRFPVVLGNKVIFAHAGDL
ncbi:MAG: hypothetical protein ABJA02_12660 [Acidobacteriota bacterium]